MMKEPTVRDNILIALMRAGGMLLLILGIVFFFKGLGTGDPLGYWLFITAPCCLVGWLFAFGPE